jgi:hypothetical protein
MSGNKNSRSNAVAQKGPGIFFLTTLLFLMIFCASAVPLYSQNLNVLQSEAVNVYFEKSLVPEAQTVIRIFPKIRSELESSLAWKADFRPNVLLVPDDETFSMMAGNAAFVAYALPERMLIVVNNTRMNKEPYLLPLTLKHELCHLMLHRYIQNSRLPRWLDEGVCQWTSGGFTELIAGRKPPNLAWAALSGRFIPLEKIASSFPEDDLSLSLAYEESRSITDFIVKNYGKNGILNILNSLRDGHDIKSSVPVSIGISLGDLEKNWQEHQTTAGILMTYLMGNIYTILFLFAALLTVAIYIRVLIRKRRFKDPEQPFEDQS